MDDEPYGYNSIEEYYQHRPSTTMPPPEHLLSPVNYQAFSGRIPMFGSSDHVFYVSSQVSDDASAVAEIRGSNLEEEEVSTVIRAKIASHPLYSKLLEAFIDCQKVGAPPEIANLFGEICRENDQCRRSTSVSTCLGSDPELDEFMETYCDILVKYKSDLAKSFNEATTFFNGIEKQLGNLCNGASRSYVSDEAAGSSGDEFCEGGARVQESNQRGVGRELKDKLGVDRELKDKLFRKYSSYISSLKHEFSKKKKKGKLPREARQMLLEWWTIHYKWPYPTEADKVAMAESTGLDQKQINNWFINQRKRHWKPSEDMQIAVMDSLYGPFYSND